MSLAVEGTAASSRRNRLQAMCAFMVSPQVKQIVNTASGVRLLQQTFAPVVYVLELRLFSRPGQELSGIPSGDRWKNCRNGCAPARKRAAEESPGSFRLAPGSGRAPE